MSSPEFKFFKIKSLEKGSKRKIVFTSSIFDQIVNCCVFTSVHLPKDSVDQFWIEKILEYINYLMGFDNDKK